MGAPTELITGIMAATVKVAPELTVLSDTTLQTVIEPVTSGLGVGVTEGDGVGLTEGEGVGVTEGEGVGLGVGVVAGTLQSLFKIASLVEFQFLPG